MDKKKRFENPELEIIRFTNDDIITDSTEKVEGLFGNVEPDPEGGDTFTHDWW